MALAEKKLEKRINLLKFGAADEIFWMFNVSPVPVIPNVFLNFGKF